MRHSAGISSTSSSLSSLNAFATNLFGLIIGIWAAELFNGALSLIWIAGGLFNLWEEVLGLNWRETLDIIGGGGALCSWLSESSELLDDLWRRSTRKVNKQIYDYINWCWNIICKHTTSTSRWMWWWFIVSVISC